MSKSRGKLILAPCGTGKSSWIESLTLEEKKVWLDGDQVLVAEGVKNRHYFWYRPGHQQEQAKIIAAFEPYLERGCHILYSGNPSAMAPSLLVIPLSYVRSARLQSRGDYVPSLELFELEESSYAAAAKSVPTISGDIPSTAVLAERLQ